MFYFGSKGLQTCSTRIALLLHQQRDQQYLSLMQCHRLSAHLQYLRTDSSNSGIIPLSC